jgi:CheY-specific phosphatase CheX
MSALSSNDWLDAMIEAFEETATSMMGFEGATVDRVFDTVPDRWAGSWLALVGSGDQAQVGIAGDREACDGMARALLGFEPDEEIADDDVVDAMSEIVNVVAGGLKTRIADRQPGLTLGLPVFFRGQPRLTPQLECAVAEVTVGEYSACLLVVRPSK